MCKENHSFHEWFHEAYGGEPENQVPKKRRNKCRLQLEEGKPPSDEGGGCPEGRRRERKNQIILSPSLLLRKIQPPRQRGPWCGASFPHYAPAHEERLLASRKGALHSWRIVLRVYVLREEQRAMPAHEEPPVLPGVPFYAQAVQDRPGHLNMDQPLR